MVYDLDHSTPTVTRGSVEIDADRLHGGPEIGEFTTIAPVINKVEGANDITVLATGLRECLAGDVAGLAVLNGDSLDASEGDDQGECGSGEMHFWEYWI
jgi:hypothetical protein